MKIVFLLKSLYLQCFYHVKFFLLTMVLVSVSYAVLMTSLAGIMPLLSAKPIWNAVADEKMDNIYKINMWQHYVTGVFDFQSFDGLLSDINEIDGVRGAGLYFMDSVFSQEKKDTLFVSEELLGMLPLQTVEGVGCDFSGDGEEVAVFVGYELKDQYPAGTSFSVMGITYRVKGVLKKNSLWPVGATNHGEWMSLDYVFVVGLGHCEQMRETGLVYVLLGLDNFYYYLEPGADAEKIRQAVMQIAQEKHFQIYDAYRLDRIVKDAVKDLLGEPEYFIMPITLVIISAVVMLLSAVLNVIIRKRNIGVMYSIGYSGRDIVQIFTMENAMKLLLGFMAALAYCVKVMGEYMQYDNCISLIWYILPVSILVALLMLYIGDRASLTYIRKINLAEVMGGMGCD